MRGFGVGGYELCVGSWELRVDSQLPTLNS